MKLGSIFASAAGSIGGNSTTRIAVPLSGGDRPIRLAALSSLKESAGGDESVIQRLAAGLPDGVKFGRPRKLTAHQRQEAPCQTQSG